MSEPKRYHLEMHKANDGDWLLYSDYARLKAECQARQAENSVLAVECDSLKAEVERLTLQAKGMSKAGWSLVNAHQYDASISYWNKCINDWQNADKGVQS